ncbi:hypothetical protein WA158_004990 [Blastocystis sp. Blastoise]
MHYSIFFCFILAASAAFCGRYSDDCSTVQGQDIDYVFYANTFGDVYKIEMQNVLPADSTCGENHVYGLIWTYDVRSTLGTRKYSVYSSDVALITYNLTATSNIDCGVTLESGVQYSLQKYTCRYNGVEAWHGMTSLIHRNETFEFDMDENGKIFFNRGTYTYVNADGCPLGVNDNTQTIIIIVVVFCVILLVIFFVYKKLNKRAVKTIGGEKTKLYKQEKKQLQNKKIGDNKMNNKTIHV